MRARGWLAAAAALLLLCGTVPTAAALEALVPVGQTVGLELETDGVYVLRFDGENTPAEVSGIKPGDRIVRINGAALERAEQLRAAADRSGGERLILDVDRNGKPMSFSVCPERAESGWRLGVFLQDRVSGLGTVTFYDPESGLFGALGHGVYEARSGRPMAIEGGTAVDAVITEESDM